MQDDVWSDHTNILAGLTDDYSHDGRARVELVYNTALPSGVRRSELNFILLTKCLPADHNSGRIFGLDQSAGFHASACWRRQHVHQAGSELSGLTTQRDALAAQIIQVLEDAEFAGQSTDFKTSASLVTQAAQLLEEVAHLRHGD